MATASEQNAALIESLYEALDRHDGEAMAACYHPEAHFRDPAFGDLHGEEPGAMWRMLTGRAEDLSVELLDHEADEATGSAHWVARYTFETGRPVVNDIQARFRFADGRIVDHVDRFGLRRWASQALGPVGSVLGLTPLLRLMIRRRTRRQLDEFMAGAGRSD